MVPPFQESNTGLLEVFHIAIVEHSGLNFINYPSLPKDLFVELLSQHHASICFGAKTKRIVEYSWWKSNYWSLLLSSLRNRPFGYMTDYIFPEPKLIRTTGARLDVCENSLWEESKTVRIGLWEEWKTIYWISCILNDTINNNSQWLSYFICCKTILGKFVDSNIWERRYIVRLEIIAKDTFS